MPRITTEQHQMLPLGSVPGEIESLLNGDAKRLKHTRGGVEATEAGKLGSHGFFDRVTARGRWVGVVDVAGTWNQLLCTICCLCFCQGCHHTHHEYNNNGHQHGQAVVTHFFVVGAGVFL
uniref:Uncharacterized protein n=1 Tax=Fagus sylvatica TaxID=28930 RepID=A0A2N9EQG8_FAGSY